MPDQITNRGTTDQGNRWDTRVDESGNTGYRYSNKDGSWHYQNTDGSTYHNFGVHATGNGYAQYTSPLG